MYSYQAERPKLFTEEGQVKLLKVRDTVKGLLREAGAFQMCMAWKDVGGDSWLLLALVDRLVELGEIREIPQAHCAGQYRVFVSAKE